MFEADWSHYSDGVLSDPSGEIVVKPCQQSEIDFYESTAAHPDFSLHIPTFIGHVSLGSDTTVAQAAGTLVLPGETVPDPSPAGPDVDGATLNDGAWAPSGGGKIDTDSAIVLENVAFGYKKPNILDVKLGARLWADDAPVAKRVKLNKVAEETTSKPLGFRIAGMKSYLGAHITNNNKEGITADGYRLYGKMYGRGFNVDTIAEGFREYFHLLADEVAKGPIRKVIRRFIDDLEAMAQAIGNEESRMYSASLLFVYEGDREVLQDAIESEKDIIAALEAKSTETDHESLNGNGTVEEDEDGRVKFPSIQSLKLIDFAHAEWTPGQGPDENLLHGIRNVIKTLNGLI